MDMKMETMEALNLGFDLQVKKTTQLNVNDIFQVVETGKFFQIMFKKAEIVKFVNIDDYSADWNTVTNKQIIKGLESGKLKVIATNLKADKI